ncbi:MAG: hypothetical protein GTO40_31285, partial [Deltaproteobacteria bacterium]|nr:hypothetical protein [Deltaproteobacteria bacterium]
PGVVERIFAAQMGMDPYNEQGWTIKLTHLGWGLGTEVLWSTGCKIMATEIVHSIDPDFKLTEG